MKLFARFAIALTVLLALVSLASAQGTWTPLTNQPPAGVGTMKQLRDGRILVHNDDTQAWYIFTPDAQGNYVNGTWAATGTLPGNYAPLYYGSQVLLEGKHVVIQGGEYNAGAQVWTTAGAVGTITPFGGVTWASNAPPTGWTTVGDAQSVILADGRYMQANCCDRQSAFYNGPNSWIMNNLIAGVDNDEGAYTLLPNNKVLMVDAWSTACSAFNSSELFDPGAGNTWACGPDTPVQLWDNAGHELGPALLMHNGKVFQVGATNATAVYDPTANTWGPGPTPAGGLTGYDAPGAIEPNGKALIEVAPPGFAAGCQMMEYNPASNTLALAPNPTNCPGDPSFVGHLMVLPSGQIMFTDFSGFVEVYTAAGSADPVAQPTILASSTHVAAGSVNNVLYGKQLNGLGQNNAYGDDYQGDTNYPLVKLTCLSASCNTGTVHWAFTHDDSTHTIKPGTIMFTKYDVPAGVPSGKYQLNAVVNGITSNTIIVSVP